MVPFPRTNFDRSCVSVCCAVLCWEVRQRHTRADTHQDGETKRSSRVEGGGSSATRNKNTEKWTLGCLCITAAVWRWHPAFIVRNFICFNSVTLQASQTSVPVSGPGSLPGHTVSRSYLPSAAGQAAYYQAETCGGLAVCQPLTRISNHHHFQGESPAEEVSSSDDYVDSICGIYI